MILQNLINKIKGGDERSKLVKKNILFSIVIKGLNIIIGLLYVPVMIDYLNPSRYGIWVTLTSIITWISVFDIGLGNGLRNKLSEALAKGEKHKSQRYVSTTYVLLVIIISFFLILFYFINYWIDWSVLLNADKTMAQELKILSFIVISLFGLKFVLNTISVIFLANQLSAYSNFLELMSNSLGLLSVYILTSFFNISSLIIFGFTVMISPVLVYFIMSMFYFNNKYSFLKPKLRMFERKYVKELTSLGLQFFVIQIATIIIFQTSNILISHFFSPAEVTPYNVAFKYYSIPSMAWGIIMVPLWSAFTDAKAVEDFSWIKKTIPVLNKLLLITIAVIILMTLISSEIISVWTNGKVFVESNLVWIFAVYTIIIIWNNIFAFFLNGISKVQIQIYTAIPAAILHIPIAYLLVYYFKMGSEGVVLSMVIVLSFFAIAGPLEANKILKSWKKT